MNVFRAHHSQVFGGLPPGTPHDLFSFHWRETCVLSVQDSAGSEGSSEALALPPESPGSGCYC